MPVLLCPPQIPHGLPWDWFRASAVRGQPEPIALPSRSSDNCLWEWRVHVLGLVHSKLTETEQKQKWNYCPHTANKSETTVHTGPAKVKLLPTHSQQKWNYCPHTANKTHFPDVSVFCLAHILRTATVNYCIMWRLKENEGRVRSHAWLRLALYSSC